MRKVRKTKYDISSFQELLKNSMLKVKITGKAAKVKQLKKNGSGKPCNFVLPPTEPLKFHGKLSRLEVKTPKELGKL